MEIYDREGNSDMVLKGRFLCALGFLALCLSFSVSATGNYTYTEEGKPMKEPSAYEIQTVVDGANLGCGRFNEPTDVFVAEDGSIYIADSGNNRIVALKDNLELSHIVDGFVGSDGKNETFHKPEGIFATADKLYVADTGNKRYPRENKKASLQKSAEVPAAPALQAEALPLQPYDK